MVSLGVYFISSLGGSIENLFASGTYTLFDGCFFRDEYRPGACLYRDALNVVPPTLSPQDGCLQDGNVVCFKRYNR